jgi:hypothetical protein
MNIPYNEFKLTVAHELWRQAGEEVKALGYWKIRRIIMSLGVHVIDEILNTNEGVLLPNGLGIYQIAGVKQPKKTRYRKQQLVRTDYAYYKLTWIHKPFKKYLPQSVYWKAHSTRLFRDQLIQKIKNDDFFHWTVFATYTDSKRYRHPSLDRLEKLKSIYDDNW